MSRPAGATHQHDQTKRYYRKDQYGKWQYWDSEIWVYSFCMHGVPYSQRLKLLD